MPPPLPAANCANNRALASEKPTNHRGRGPGCQPASSNRALPQPPATATTASMPGSAQARCSSLSRSLSLAENQRQRPAVAAGISRLQPAAAKRCCSLSPSVVASSHQVPGAIARTRLPGRKGVGTPRGWRPWGNAVVDEAPEDFRPNPDAERPAPSPHSNERRRISQPSRLASRRRPSSPPVRLSQARSGWGIKPSTLPRGLHNPATSPIDPLGLAV